MKLKKLPKAPLPRFGIGEWFGKSVGQLSIADRRAFAMDALKSEGKSQRTCPFKSLNGQGAVCSKRGGVCSFRLYAWDITQEPGGINGVLVEGKNGALRAACPYRFHENGEIFKWVGETILGDADPKIIGEVGFLETASISDTEPGDDVGMIDMILMSSKTTTGCPTEWAALEIQAVYFSGQKMAVEFHAFNESAEDGILFPKGKRHPDYRSSGPKRLMPQLQIKVPTLRRWGKKMAVVVDRSFFDSLGEMDYVTDVSNADIVWFIVKFEYADGESDAHITRDEIRFTTLERAVEGLTGGKPVSLKTFENRIRERINKKSKRSQSIALGTTEPS